ncbi:hypothetical protein EZV62_010707 [Acer yangbiense]|uniref:Protein TIFY n=1 Tax=Acer yangbiense TaxID=1000413 RepID=A0A5C7I2I0_9ROSI|nr:hypothetical protein EZV62_010707 [Acer yangbiense]
MAGERRLLISDRNLDNMLPGETVSRSLLEKPLHQLTEDDISQLTREDCRRYLKDKGMRKPSWNKSQAIQQVISLKTLLETTSDSDAAEARKKLYSVPSNSTVSVKGASESGPYRPQDAPKSDLSRDPSGQQAADNDSVSPRITQMCCEEDLRGSANEPVGQMTIFYCGKVNVYDDVPDDKVQEIMQFAASPDAVNQEVSSDRTAALCSFSCHLQPTGIKAVPSSPMGIFPTSESVKVAETCRLPLEGNGISHEDSLDGPTSRKALVQRYREKRKDRFKNKRKIAMPSSTGLNVHINRCMGDRFSNEQLNLSDACSTSQSRPMHNPIACRSVENVAKISNLSTGLNDKDNCLNTVKKLFCFRMLFTECRNMCTCQNLSCILHYYLYTASFIEIHDTLVAQPLSSTSAKFN